MKILVPLDGSRTAEAALPIAVRLASDPEMSLVLMAVADVRVNQDPAPAEPEIAPIQEARSYLEAAKGSLLPATEQVFTTVWSGPAAAMRLAPGGPPSTAISAPISCPAIATSAAWPSICLIHEGRTFSIVCSRPAMCCWKTSALPVPRNSVWPG